MTITASNKVKFDNKAVCNSIQSFYKKFLPLFSKNELILMFIDPDGKILFLRSHQHSHNSFVTGEKVNFISKDYLSQNKKQNSTISINQIIKGQITQVYEFEKLAGWYYKGIPVHNCQGNILGFFLILTSKKDFYQFLTPLIQSFYNIIEEDILNKDILSNLNISKEFINIITKSSKDGILYLDKNAKIKYMNDMAGNILHVNPQQSINQYVGNIVDFEPVILSTFKTQRGYTDREFIIHSPTWGALHFIKTAVIVKDEHNMFAGVVDFFREITRVRKFVTSYIGAQAKFNFSDIIGNNVQLKESIRISKLAAQTSSNVLIIGETGTGKEMVAQAIHYEGKRQNGPFVTINCGAIPRDLAESEFFGYEPGSFTGADKKGRIGKFELANGGTIFLDEIGELPISLQIKLLRVIQERQIVRVGGIKQIPVNVRIIAASNKDLYKEIQIGKFRNDLYHRINVIKINLPSLRNRKEDIPSLIDHFNRKLSFKLERNVPKISPNFVQPLLEHNFPGNIRELENIIERALNLCEDDNLTSKYLPKEIVDTQDHTELSPIEDNKRKQIINILAQTDWNITKAANKLQISRPTLYHYINKWNLNKNLIHEYNYLQYH
jgi:sigma-54 dependent transcriptional regulator, acetoin dehydrogenase operon transcriptional activator AcoR